MLRRVSEHEAVFVLDDPTALRRLIAAEGGTGQRFAMVLVQLADDSTPVVPVPVDPRIKSGVLQATRRLLGLVANMTTHRSVQCATLCRDPGYGWYLHEMTDGEHDFPRVSEQRAIFMARQWFDIDSRAELDDEEKFAAAWQGHLEAVRLWCLEKEEACRKT